METTDILFALLRYAVCGEDLNKQTAEACTSANLEAVYNLAKKHDLAHLVAHAVEGLNLPECEALTKLKNAKMRAIYRYARMSYEYEQISRILEDAEVCFIPLKGSVLRGYYPEPWMRTSGDIDILVKDMDFDRAISALQNHGWKAEGPAQYQNICLRSPNGVLLELHFNIRVKMDAADAVLDDVWKYIEPVNGKQYEVHQTQAFFLLHHLAHMAKHILVAGCGIRPFLDLWVLTGRQDCNEAAFLELCNSAKLNRFADAAFALMNAWFGGNPHSEVSKHLACYIIGGGVYGSLSNKVVMAQIRTGGKLKNLWNRLFVPIGEMQLMYPILKKRKWLLPVYHFVRWYQVIASGRITKAVTELQLNQSSSSDQIQDAEMLIKYLGLNDK